MFKIDYLMVKNELLDDFLAESFNDLINNLDKESVQLFQSLCKEKFNLPEYSGFANFFSFYCFGFLQGFYALNDACKE